MALNFPTPTADGQVYSAPNGVTYRWSATSGLWTAWGTGTNSAMVGDTPPLNPTAGQLWWSSALGQMFIYFVDANSGQWVPTNATASIIIPPGLIADFGGPTAPAGWYLCDGSLKSRSIDAPLFTAIGVTHGAGDGSSTFAVPDLRGRVTAGADPTNLRLGSGVAGAFPVNGAVLGAAAGESSHVLLDAELAAHTHALAGGYMNAGAMGPGIFNTANTGPQGVWQNNYTNADGGSQAHNNVQPTLITTKIIKR